MTNLSGHSVQYRRALPVQMPVMGRAVLRIASPLAASSPGPSATSAVPWPPAPAQQQPQLLLQLLLVLLSQFRHHGHGCNYQK